MSARKNTIEIWLIRHAHASWKHPDLRDFARTLDGRGRKEAMELGAWLRHKNLQPARILVSPAVRTLQTFHLAFPNHHIQQPEVMLLPQLYLGGSFDLLTALESNWHAPGPCILIGHNPGISELVTLLKSGFSEEMGTGCCYAFSGTGKGSLSLKHAFKPGSR